MDKVQKSHHKLSTRNGKEFPNPDKPERVDAPPRLSTLIVVPDVRYLPVISTCSIIPSRRAPEQRRMKGNSLFSCYLQPPLAADFREKINLILTGSHWLSWERSIGLIISYLWLSVWLCVTGKRFSFISWNSKAICSPLKVRMKSSYRFQRVCSCRRSFTWLRNHNKFCF